MPFPIIPLCWLTFVAYWVFRSRSVKATVERASKSEVLAYKIPTFVGAVLIYLSWRLPGPLGLRVNPDSAPFVAAGDLLCLAGLAGAIWARNTLAGNWSNDPTFKKGHELIERGPYRWVRHPIYTAILLMCLGSAIAAGVLGSWLGLLVLFAGFLIKLRQEETILLRHFSKAYPDYMRRVKALVPFVY
jgi:protein-S-isoprenylcysteine O-methyltransferase Ste14